MAFRAKRKYQRSVQREAVKIMSQAGLEYATYEDLSAGGLKLWMDHDVEPQTTLAIEFTLRDLEGGPVKIRVRGKVVRSLKSGAGFEVGVQFLDLNQPTQVAIEKLFEISEGPF
jgi:hypothetical protein